MPSAATPFCRHFTDPISTHFTAHFAAVLAVCAALSSALANDSNSAFGTGGLEQVESSSIRMVSEDLFISGGEIRVRYLFRNLSDQPQTVTVAFPLQFELGFRGGDRLRRKDGMEEKAVDLLEFSIIVDGKPVAIEQTVRRAVTKQGVDVTERLQRLGFPLPLVPSYHLDGEGMPKLDDATWQELRRDGLVGRDEDSHHIPLWRTRLSLVWTQTYAPRQEVVVKHSYKPFNGSFFLDRLNYEPTLKQYCANPGFRRASHRHRRSFLAKNINYILTTANSWAGPIEDFHLTVDKGARGMLLSLCGMPLKKTGPTTFETRLKNFSPQRDLDILILYPL